MLLKDKAFTLIELSIYMAMFSVLVTTAFVFLNQTQEKVLKESIVNDKLIRSTLAVDLLRRDLQSADPTITNWDIKHLIFKKNCLNKLGEKVSKIVSWQILKRGLCRIEGSYDFATKMWGKRTISLVDPNIKEIKVELVFGNNKKLVEEVSVLYKLDNQELNEKVFLQNRLIC